MADITREQVQSILRSPKQSDTVRDLAFAYLTIAERARDAEAKLAAVRKFAQDCGTEVKRRQAMKMHGPHLDAAQVAQRLFDLLGGDQGQPKPDPCSHGPGCWHQRTADAIVDAPASAAAEDVTP
jgi:hypothetical protein